MTLDILLCRCILQCIACIVQRMVLKMYVFIVQSFSLNWLIGLNHTGDLYYERIKYPRNRNGMRWYVKSQASPLEY